MARKWKMNVFMPWVYFGLLLWFALRWYCCIAYGAGQTRLALNPESYVLPLLLMLRLNSCTQLRYTFISGFFPKFTEKPSIITYSEAEVKEQVWIGTTTGQKATIILTCENISQEDGIWRTFAHFRVAKSSEVFTVINIVGHGSPLGLLTLCSSTIEEQGVSSA